MTHNIKGQPSIQIFQSEDGQVQLEVALEQDTVWLSQLQMAELFGTKRPAITKHLGNIFKSKELHESVVCSILEHTTTHGAISDKTQTRHVKYYNLDAIISVGYRVNSSRATQFRIWATGRLKDYLVQGYAINQQRFDHNAAELQQALALINKTAQSPELTQKSGRGLVDIVSRYTQTFLWLQGYDQGLLSQPSGQDGGDLPSHQQASEALAQLKQDLIARGEATELFAKPRGDGLSALLGNLNQSVFGEAAYPTIESKAAHLLYFVVKNHPFADGNKRSGAFLFVDFLHRNQRLYNTQGHPCINDTGLAVLTLLVAESKPDQKAILIRLIMNMLAQERK
jgi:hypothetical protein